MLHLFAGLDLHTGLLLLLALAFVLFYEAINGFHDTANAVATVIYTRAMRSQLAVVMAAVFNFLGVLLGGLSVAYAIVHMLPTDLLLNMGSSHGLAMVFSMLLAAIIWNLGTWYFGLPASSSHTLIGAIIGIGLTNALMTGTSVVDALNIPKVLSIFGSLIVSPIVGLVFAGGLIFLLRRYWSGTKKRARIHLTPAEREKKDGKKKPPFWTRIALILSAIGVAFSHGANDGQKGIGLVMLVLIGVAPAGFVVNMNATGYEITRTRDAINNVEAYFEQHPALLKQATGADQLVPAPEAGATQPAEFHCHPSNTINALNRLKGMLTTDVESYDKLSLDQRSQMRRIMLCVSDTIDKVVKMPGVSADDQRLLKKLKSDMLSTIEYAPVWIIMAVALALGIGTMIGWRRVATTIGEKIGKKGMTYAQGMSAQMTAAVSIGLASYTGMPVSTTHVLSSSVAGTMVERTAAGIARGELDVRLPVTGDERDEVDRLRGTINRMAEGLEETEKMKNEFISSVSHELRTPLTSIRGWVETLRTLDDPSDENYRKGLEIINNETARLYNMVEELLDFSRLQNGRLKMTCRPLDLVAELTDAVLFCEARIQREGLVLVYNEPEEMIPVYADPDRLRQVFINILDNAIKYSAPGGRITVKLWAGEYKAFIELIDQGRGIPPEDLENVKTKFYKGSNSVRGSGIGLALVDSIMTALDGTMDIKSTLGRGTVVTLGLPLYKNKKPFS